MTDYVLDSFAVLALLQGEPGAERVEEILRGGQAGTDHVSISMINVGEIAYIVERHWGQEYAGTVLAYLDNAALDIVPAAKQRVLDAAHLKASHPISYADAFAAGLAMELGATLLTNDLEFRAMESRIRIEWLHQPPGG